MLLGQRKYAMRISSYTHVHVHIHVYKSIHTHTYAGLSTFREILYMNFVQLFRRDCCVTVDLEMS
jgi:hypothetical protein